MWFNSRRNEEPYPGLTCYRFSPAETRDDLLEIKDGSTGVAWLVLIKDDGPRRSDSARKNRLITVDSD